ncbi:aspartyl-tRNA amidotransferase subunit B [Chelatococcus reniformis]|uniref:Aspartyl-tRNA amidotransferase subunit B n=2 Tax=Chelatococcus reniformis TaxID=1494448 RepID=A0A916USA0_9HYPH|nr:aspartyl-tRNA amidotransferase subunit B [Chelatococcus reniformis]
MPATVNDDDPARENAMLRERFSDSLKDAMRSGDKRRLSTVRLIQAALKDKDIEARGAGKGQATDEEILALLQRMIKQRQESADIYGKAGRAELEQQEREEIIVVESFLPAQMDEAAILAAVKAAIAETGAASIKDMGKVIASLKGSYAGQMDFAKASAVVKHELGAG